ncbi:STAS domain-containing protein [Luteolibacter sp. SL250]|uniref:STAS domain-containing protein n=1 Tax=Luteolibacter sp. SL250 TaxID=2995170 RepID=UPI002D1E41A1|nr:STAS domain-containing protein [Luteolibacter sp. SL250]
MITECPILVGTFERFSWIRCVGKGSFLTSPAMKAFGDDAISNGERCLVVDLGACTGMDSTFMGTLAGMAARLSVVDGGTLQIADAGERNRRSLEDLGLDFLMEIDPPSADWRGKVEEVRKSLKPPKNGVSAGNQARHVLEAHQVLSQANESNARKFSTVVDLLEAELAEKQGATEGS